MISLTCTHCQTVLSIDDAFAGGVCRCQHCGTIQTVPMHLKHGATVKAGASDANSANGPKALYQSQRSPGKGRPDEAIGVGSGTGLEDLADVVASSGLAGSGLSTSLKPRKGKRRPPVSTAVATPPPRSKTPVLVATGALLVAAVCLTGWWLSASATKQQQSQSGTPQPNGGTSSPTGNGDAPAPAAGSQFCGVPLEGSSIVYLLDRGDSAKEVFDPMKEATYSSIQGLGPDRKFQVLLWDNGTTEAGYPSGSVTFATPANLDACRKALEDVSAEHQSTIQSPLKRAVAEAPDSIVIVTAKGFELDDAFVSDVQSILGSSSPKLYTFSLRTGSPALETLAKRSGGAYKSLSDGALRAGSAG
jgi:hypothetical protein